MPWIFLLLALAAFAAALFTPSMVVMVAGLLAALGLLLAWAAALYAQGIGARRVGPRRGDGPAPPGAGLQ